MLLGIIIAGTGGLCLSQALRFPRAVRGASSAIKRLRGLPCPVLRRTLIFILEFAHARRKCDSIFEESSCLPLQSTECQNQQSVIKQLSLYDNSCSSSFNLTSNTLHAFLIGSALVMSTPAFLRTSIG
jgi:hypothetical protein